MSIYTDKSLRHKLLDLPLPVDAIADKSLQRDSSDKNAKDYVWWEAELPYLLLKKHNKVSDLGDRFWPTAAAARRRVEVWERNNLKWDGKYQEQQWQGIGRPDELRMRQWRQRTSWPFHFSNAILSTEPRYMPLSASDIDNYKQWTMKRLEKLPDLIRRPFNNEVQRVS